MWIFHLTELDPNDKALITPTPPALTEPLPERVMMCFFPEVVDDLVATHGGRHIGEFSREIGAAGSTGWSTAGSRWPSSPEASVRRWPFSISERAISGSRVTVLRRLWWRGGRPARARARSSWWSRTRPCATRGL